MLKKRILITDDDAEMREETTLILKDEGYIVKTASDGKAALKLIKKEKFDLLLLDLKMPVMTGYEVLKNLDLFKIKHRVIVLTGSILASTLPDEKGLTNQEKTRILKLADAVMSKPFDILKLLAKVKELTLEQ